MAVAVSVYSGLDKPVAALKVAERLAAVYPQDASQYQLRKVIACLHAAMMITEWLLMCTACCVTADVHCLLRDCC